jgi:hypothetical protein
MVTLPAPGPQTTCSMRLRTLRRAKAMLTLHAAEMRLIVQRAMC